MLHHENIKNEVLGGEDGVKEKLTCRIPHELTLEDLQVLLLLLIKRRVPCDARNADLDFEIEEGAIH